MMDEFDWLMEWFKSYCDGDWEHEYGIRIETLDNPGWCVRINLVGTILEGKSIERVERDNGDNDWISCWVESNIFEGAGDPRKLKEMIKIFKCWAES